MNTRIGLVLLLAMSSPTVGCQSGTEPSEPTDAAQPAATDRKILIDASRDGGVWWFPQAGNFLPEEDHQGKALAEYLRGRGYEVNELPRGTIITEALLSSYKYVIRPSEFGDYRQSELDAYRNFVARETTLILLGDHMSTDPTDQLAEALGVTFSGDVSGTLTRFAEHAITDGLPTGQPYANGAFATNYDDEFDIIAWIDDDLPVMGVAKSYEARVFFSGETNMFLNVPEQLLDNLLRWGFDLHLVGAPQQSSRSR